MNTPKEVLDIPGYFYDTNTRRYYKQDLVNPKPKIITRTQEENSLPEKVIKRKISVLNLLNKRETGFGKGSFENRVVSLKSTSLCCTQSKFGVNHSYTCENVEFLKAGAKTLYVEYSDKQGTNYFVEEKLHSFSPPKNTYNCFYGRYPHSFSTVDMVELPINANFLFFVVSNSNSWKILLCPRLNLNLREKVYTSPEPVWCCAINEFSTNLAFGEQNRVGVGRCFAGYHGGYTIPLKGQVRSVEFNKQGDLLFTGHHTGHIGSTDLRTKDSVFYFQLHNKGIDETMLLSDESSLICGAFDGMLCKVDLRMRKPVCEYFGHVKTPRKFFLSKCESNHLLCASGSDNVTRLWNLNSGGEPLRCINPPLCGSSCRSWLVSDGYKYYIHQFQKDYLYLYNNV